MDPIGSEAIDKAAAGNLDILAWLDADDILGGGEVALVASLGRRLRQAGLALDRLVLYQRTLHPDILARAIAWAPGEPVEIYDRQLGFDPSENFAASPLHQVMESGSERSIALEPSAGPAWSWSRALRGRRLVALVILPLGNAEGPVSALTFGTARPGGFAASDRRMLERIMPAVRKTYEASQGAAET